jgi:hypothetical protein
MMKYKIHLSFCGKDSVMYDNTIEVPKNVYDQFQKILAGKSADQKLFKVGSGEVNAFLNGLQKGTTAKNLRTVVSNETLINNLKTKTVTKQSTEAEKIRAIFEANLEIAKTLNHQKNVSKTYKESETKVKERVAATKTRLKELKAKQKEKLDKLDEKAAGYRVAFKGQKLLNEKLAEVSAAKTKLIAQIDRAKTAIERAELNLDKKKLTKDINLGTSLSAYADFRVILSYLKYIDLPISKIFTAGQLKNISNFTDKNIDENWWKSYPN